MLLNRPLATVTPTLDGEVLRVLAGNDSDFTVRQLRSVLGGYSEHGIRKVLVRLVEQGVVWADRYGATTAYRLNREHLAAGAIVALAGLRETFFAEVRERLLSWPDCLRYACVFGSSVSGDMRPDSDVDVLLIGDDDHDQLVWQERFVDLSLKIFRWTGNRPALIEMSVTELAERASEPLVRSIHDRRVTVAGDAAWFDDRIRAGAASR